MTNPPLSFYQHLVQPLPGCRGRGRGPENWEEFLRSRDTAWRRLPLLRGCALSSLTSKLVPSRWTCRIFLVTATAASATAVCSLKHGFSIANQHRALTSHLGVMPIYSGKRRDRVSRASWNLVLSNILTYYSTTRRGDGDDDDDYAWRECARRVTSKVVMQRLSLLTFTRGTIFPRWRSRVSDTTDLVTRTHVPAIISREKTPDYQLLSIFSYKLGTSRDYQWDTTRKVKHWD